MRQIPLTKGKVALVDDGDYLLLSQFAWCAIKAGAQTRIGKKRVLMHRIILNARQGEIIDHINHDRLDNRRANLRLVTHRENAWNKLKGADTKSGYKGVVDKLRNGTRCRTPRYRAVIKVGSKNVNLGSFDAPEAAAQAYDAAARHHFGEFACVNFPTKEEQDRQRQIPRRKIIRDESRLWRRVSTKTNYEADLVGLAASARNILTETEINT